jgi:flagellar basal-body rod protein FlgG
MFVRSILYSCLFCLLLLSLSGCTLPTKQNDPGNIWEQYLPVDETDSPPNLPLDSITETGRNLDAAILGEGFFQYIDPLTDELCYSRNGHFEVDASGSLIITASNGSNNFVIGCPLVPEIIIPDDAERVQIDDDGTVWITRRGDSSLQHAGQIIVATFSNPEGLHRIDQYRYRSTEASGSAMPYVPGNGGTGLLKSQYLETN